MNLQMILNWVICVQRPHRYCSLIHAYSFIYQKTVDIAFYLPSKHFDYHYQSDCPNDITNLPHDSMRSKTIKFVNLFFQNPTLRTSTRENLKVNFAITPSLSYRGKHLCLPLDKQLLFLCSQPKSKPQRLSKTQLTVCSTS